MNFEYYIIDDKPKEFGGPELISGHRTIKEAKFMLIHFKGIEEDSYRYQYAKVVSESWLRRSWQN